MNRLYRVNPSTLAIEHTTTLADAGLLWELAAIGTERAYAIDRDMDILARVLIGIASKPQARTEQLLVDEVRVDTEQIGCE